MAKACGHVALTTIEACVRQAVGRDRIKKESVDVSLSELTIKRVYFSGKSKSLNKK